MLTKEEIKKYLFASGDKQIELHQLACKVRDENLSNSCSIRAVIEITNNCTVHCKYCEMNIDNRELKRETLKINQILTCIKEIHSVGIKTVMLQGAENAKTTDLVQKALEKINGSLEIILCLGNKKEDEYLKLYKKGAKGYILKLETTNVGLHKELRGKPLYERIDCLNSLRKIGYSVGTGIICGLPGQTVDSIVEDLFFIGQQTWSMCSVSPFIPPTMGEFKDEPQGNLDITLNIISIIRLLQPTAMIPTVSALNMLEKDAQVNGLNAGANVLTVNFTPNGFKENYRIYSKERIKYIVNTEDAKKRIKKANMKDSLTSTLGPVILSDEKELIKSFFNEKWKDKNFELQHSIYKFENPLLEEFLKKNIKGEVCDIGCGDGRYALRFANRVDYVTAIDFSKFAIKRLSDRADHLKLDGKLKTIIQDARNLEIQENKFNIILLANMLHYLSPLEIAGLLIILKDALTRGGKLYVGLETNIKMNYEVGKYFTFANQYNHSISQLERLVKAAGFGIDPNEKRNNTIEDDFELPLVVRKKLETESVKYKRTFDLLEFIATRE